MSASLEPGEEIRLDARPHWASNARPLSLSVAAAAAGVWLVFWGADTHASLGYAGAGLILLGSFFGVRTVWRRERTSIVLTSEKLVVVHGILLRRSAAVRLSRVPALEFEQGVVGRLLGYGTLVAGDFEVPHVPQARRVRRLLG